MINTHLKVFDTEANYEAGKLNLDMPNVSYCEDTEKLKYVNSKKDLYNIYGATTGAGDTVTFKINGNNTTATSDDNKEFGVVVTGTTTGISFKDCANITMLDLSKLDTSNVTNIGNIFSNCTALTSLNLSNVVFDNVTVTSYMFNNVYQNMTITMDNTSDTTFNNFKNSISRDTNFFAKRCTIIRDELTWTYNGSSWISQ